MSYAIYNGSTLRVYFENELIDTYSNAWHIFEAIAMLEELGVEIRRIRN